MNYNNRNNRNDEMIRNALDNINNIYSNQKNEIERLSNELNTAKETVRYLEGVSEKSEKSKNLAKTVMDILLRSVCEMKNEIDDAEDLEELKKCLNMHIKQLFRDLGKEKIQVIAYERGDNLKDDNVEVNPVDTTEKKEHRTVSRCNQYGCKYENGKDSFIIRANVDMFNYKKDERRIEETNNDNYNDEDYQDKYNNDQKQDNYNDEKMPDYLKDEEEMPKLKYVGHFAETRDRSIGVFIERQIPFANGKKIGIQSQREPFILGQVYSFRKYGINFIFKPEQDFLVLLISDSMGNLLYTEKYTYNKKGELFLLGE